MTHDIGPRRGIRTVVFTMVLFLAACGGAERPTLVGPDVAPADELSRQPSDDETSTDRSADTTAPAAAASTSDGSGDESDRNPSTSSGGGTGVGSGDGSDPYAVEGEIRDADGGVRAIVTPTGVLSAVIGQTDSGYVIETPCGFQAGVPWGQPLRSVDVMLDPGHGGDEEGAVADNGLTEAAVNLRVAQRTATLLAAREVSVALTRTGNYRVPITQRAKLADALAAKALVSIHHNTPKAADSTTPGTEVYVQSTSIDARRLGGLVYEQVVAGLADFDVEWVARTDAGVLNVLNDEGEDAYGINRRPATPSALIEIGYLANPSEAELFSTEAYVASVAEALADGIERYLTTDEPGSGFVSAPRAFNPSGATGGQSDCSDPPLN